MGKRFSSIITGVLMIGALLFGAASGSAWADPAGTVHYLGFADSSFDQFTANPTAEMQEWFGAHMWRMVVFSPYFDSRTSWYPNGWVYDDAYAIYRGSALAAQHPEWILRDARRQSSLHPLRLLGRQLSAVRRRHIEPGFRQAWIEQTESRARPWLPGVFIDDVNMEDAGRATAPNSSVDRRSTPRPAGR